MKIKVSEAIGAQLDGMVAKCEGEEFRWQPEYNSIGMEFEAHHYSTDWAQGGPIIEREFMDVEVTPMGALPEIYGAWRAWKHNDNADATTEQGPTPLIAAMRCYVASKLGDIVEVPEELT